MAHIDPDRAAFDRFMAEPGLDGPFTMLNLLRFKPDGGRESYEQYSRAAQPFVENAGGSLAYFGEGAGALVGDGWDAVLLVRYPSRDAFIGMIMDPAYQAISHLRTEALTEAVLQPTTGWPGV